MEAPSPTDGITPPPSQAGVFSVDVSVGLKALSLDGTPPPPTNETANYMTGTEPFTLRRRAPLVWQGMVKHLRKISARKLSCENRTTSGMLGNTDPALGVVSVSVRE